MSAIKIPTFGPALGVWPHVLGDVAAFAALFFTVFGDAAFQTKGKVGSGSLMIFRWCMTIFGG